MFLSYEPFSAGRGPNLLLALRSYCGPALNIPARPHQVFATISIERKKTKRGSRLHLYDPILLYALTDG